MPASAITDKTIVDRAGATVGYYEYGDPAGQPVLAFHGTPACGAGYAFADGPALERHLRVIAPDRPGVGRSSRREAWSVSDYPAMVASFADALGIDRFSVWGYSGGGPYAVACVAMLPQRIDSAAISSGMGEVGVFAKPADFEKTDRQMLNMAVKHPGLARRIMAVSAWIAQRRPQMAMKSFEKQMTPADRAVVPTLGEPSEAMALFTRSFQNGPHGVVADYAALAKPWGCDVSAIVAPVKIWHGTDDKMVPLFHAEQLAARLPGATLETWPGEGHLGTIAHVGEILDSFV
ncbi:MAG TPA: alpha/beta hydrolase [Ilumatobacteraceae bacterium]|jgi:pimeloyl-ACP methyl ester carboxylesterase